jgi:hypothetical protein
MTQMISEKHGTEKLMDSGTGLLTMSAEEIEQISGGYRLQFDIGSFRVFKAFRYGIIDPEVLQLDKLSQPDRQISNGF